MGWNRTPIRDEQWRPPVHPKKQVQALEQDQAAGGHRDRRVIHGTKALGRVVLRQRHQRIYAELRWQVATKPRSKHLCGVSATSRAANLAIAWSYAHDHGWTACSASIPSASGS